MLQSKGAHFEKICRRATCGEIIFHRLVVLHVAQNGLYTSILLPTPMTIAVGEMMSLSQTIGFQLLPCSSCGPSGELTRLHHSEELTNWFQLLDLWPSGELI